MIFAAKIKLLVQIWLKNFVKNKNNNKKNFPAVYTMKHAGFQKKIFSIFCPWGKAPGFSL